MNNLTPQARYLAKPFPGSSHTWAMDQIDKLSLGQSSTALDIGTGSGIFGEFLKNKGVGTILGVEIDDDSRTHCAPLYSRMSGSLEDLLAEPEAAYSEAFDLILLLDVLEHIADPFDFFAQVVPLLKPGGTILVSVPNIAHWSVRLSLMCGFFEYTNRGILDRTHLHFFTRRHLRALCRSQSSLDVINQSSSVVPVELLLPETLGRSGLMRFFARTRVLAAGVLPGLLAYQHLVALRRNTTAGSQ